MTAEAPKYLSNDQATFVATYVSRILDAAELAVIGKRDKLTLIVAAMLANGHVLLEDVPGVAKTLTARSLAAATGLTMNRVQFTPDLIPADITGSAVLSPDGNLSFRQGPIFANLVLADEINRAPAKTQSALLEAMEERQVTADGATRELASPFLVIATQNPIESDGTYPLPDAQLDRFLVKMTIGYPSRGAESEMARRRARNRNDNVDIPEAVDLATFVSLQGAVEMVHVAEPVVDYMVDITTATRGRDGVDNGVSPRGTLALFKLSRAWAAIAGRNFVLPDDVKAVAPAALGHRLILSAEQWVRQVKPESVIDAILTEVEAPVVS